MMLRNFDTDLDVQGVARVVNTVKVTETVTVTRPPSISEDMAFVAKAGETWAWDDLRDYVVHEIESRFGSFPRSYVKEAGIFKSFLGRWGDQSHLIARFVFERRDGFWNGSPVSVNRFCKNADAHFAAAIAEAISHQPVQGW